MKSTLAEINWKVAAAVASVIGLLGWFNLHISATEIDISPLPVESTVTPQSSATSSDVSAAPTDVSFPATLARPLFSPTRRDFIEEVAPVEPVEIAVEPPEIQPAEPPKLLLHGTRSISGLTSALVSLEGEESRWVGVGEEVQGWSITAVYQDRLFIGRGEGTMMISLYPGPAD